MKLDRTIALVGLRCSGKTTVGEVLARRLGLAFVDLDEEVVRFARYSGAKADSIAALIEETSWAQFRQLEAAALKLLVEPTPRIVLATGGGVVERGDNRAWLVRATYCFYLDVPLELLPGRLRRDFTVRPPVTEGGDAAAELPRLLARRDPLYRAVSTATIECGAASPEEICDRIEACLRDIAAPPAQTSGKKTEEGAETTTGDSAS